jgi:hypothetical protein
VTTRRCQRVSVRQLGPTGNHQRSWRLYSALFCSPVRGRDLRDHDGDLVVGTGMHGWGQEVADSSGMLKELPPGRADQCPIWGAEQKAATLTTHLPPADSAARTRCSRSPAIQHHDPRPGPRCAARDAVQPLTCRLLRPTKEGVSGTGLNAVRARATGPSHPHATPHIGHRRPGDLPAIRPLGQGAPELRGSIDQHRRGGLIPHRISARLAGQER